MQAAEHAVNEVEAAAERAEREALAAVKAAELAAADAEATPRSVELAAEAAHTARLAAEATERAVVAEGAHAATVGYFVVVKEYMWGRFSRDRYATEADARLVASTLWAPWILYHEQRGAYTEVLAGGLGMRHSAIRKHVSSAMQLGVHGRMGQGMYVANY